MSSLVPRYNLFLNRGGRALTTSLRRVGVESRPRPFQADFLAFSGHQRQRRRGACPVLLHFCREWRGGLGGGGRVWVEGPLAPSPLPSTRAWQKGLHTHGANHNQCPCSSLLFCIATVVSWCLPGCDCDFSRCAPSPTVVSDWNVSDLCLRALTFSRSTRTLPHSTFHCTGHASVSLCKLMTGASAEVERQGSIFAVDSRHPCFPSPNTL